MRRAALSASLLVLPGLISIGFDHFPLTGDGIEQRGFAVTAYCLLRIALAIAFFICCASAGRLIARAVPGERVSAPPSAAQLILDFGIGASTLAILLVCLGFAGALYRSTALLIMSPLLAAVPYAFYPAPHGPKAAPQAGRSSALAFLVVSNVAAALFLLLHRVLFPSEIDGDVWEHYLHYFFEVTQRTHSLWPGEVWIHFFTSKGATLQILVALISDIMAPQLVSWCFVVLTALIAYDITRFLTGARAWGLVASLAVLEAATIFHATPNFMKHHLVFAGLVTFIAWCVVQREAKDEQTRKLRLIAGMLVAFYTAIYLPVGGGILIAGAFAASIAMLALGSGFTAVRPIAAYGAAAIFGICAILLVNYAITGLALDSPLGLFWRAAELDKFERFWSRLVLEYWFIGTGAVESVSPTLAGALRPKFGWLHEVLRLRYVQPFTGMIALAFAVGVVYSIKRKEWPSWTVERTSISGVAGLLGFTVGTLALANLFPGSDSVYRLYAFSFPLVIVLFTASFAIVSRPRFHGNVAAAVFPVGIACLLSWIVLGTMSTERIDLAVAHVAGKSSMKDVLSRNDHYSDLPGGFANFLAAKRAAPGERIFYMGYSPSPGYLLPIPPLLSEPSYSFGRGYAEILYGTADRAAALLKDEGVNYFLLNMRSRLFLGIPYSELFSASNIDHRLGLHWSGGEFYLLTWKSASTRPLSPQFITMLEFKQQSVFAKLKTELGPRLEQRSSSHADALAAMREYLFERLKTKQARDFTEAFLAWEARYPSSARSSNESPRRVAEGLSLALRDFAKEAWGEDIAMDMWNLRLSEDIQSQDFGWLYEKNRSRYASREGNR